MKQRTRKIKGLELFSGSGGGSAFLPGDIFRVISANDKDHDACESYRANHPGVHVVEKDIKKVNAAMMLADKGDVDLVLGGPSCQGFSHAGAKKEDDPRNGLFKHYLRLIDEVKPKVFVFENVTGFRNMYGGRTSRKLSDATMDLGYDLKVSWVDAADYGVPQRRRRFVVMAFRRGLGLDFGNPVTFSDIMPPTHVAVPPGPKLFPAAWDGLSTPLTLRDAIGDLPLVGAGESASEYATDPQNDYQREMRAGSAVLTEHVAPDHRGETIERMKRVPPGGSVLDVPEELRRKCYDNSYGRLEWDKPAFTVTSNFGTPSSGKFIHPDRDRGLTTREGARLQSFPDSYVFFGSKGSKNLQIGNAIPPKLGLALCLAARSVILAAEKGAAA